MKTYIKEIEEPCLVIEHDEFADSPRHDDCLGYFITDDKKHYSPDRNATMMEIVHNTAEIATSQAHHIKLIKAQVKIKMNEHAVAVYPIVKYEHGAVAYSLGTVKGFDYSNNGFYIVTDLRAKRVGVEPKDYEKTIKAELEEYNKFINGEVYRFRLFDSNGVELDNCGGFYDIEDIRGALPPEWKEENLTDYLKN